MHKPAQAVSFSVGLHYPFVGINGNTTITDTISHAIRATNNCTLCHVVVNKPNVPGNVPSELILVLTGVGFVSDEDFPESERVSEDGIGDGWG